MGIIKTKCISKRLATLLNVSTSKILKVFYQNYILIFLLVTVCVKVGRNSDYVSFEAAPGNVL